MSEQVERLPERRTELWREYLQEWSTDYEGDFEWWLVKKIQVSEAQLAACQQDLEEKDAENEHLRRYVDGAGHKGWCRVNVDDPDRGVRQHCDCGYAAALEQSRSDQQPT